MATILTRGGLALALAVLIVATTTFHTVSVANARILYNQARKLADDCDSPIQRDIPGCGGEGGSSGSSGPRIPRGQAPGSNLCKNGCCGITVMGNCICCK